MVPPPFLSASSVPIVAGAVLTLAHALCDNPPHLLSHSNLMFSDGDIHAF
ncbi:MAG: hypothetical protein KDD64_12820 [Bdellovibrionales bacterium]|nr:hypothetical protein [Bdellovibrionales bacterium]